MRRVAVLALVSLAVCATTAVCAVPRCPFPARRGEGGGEDGIVKFCVDAADKDDDNGKRWRSCARCVGACTIRTYGDAIVGARAVVARTCAMRAIGAIGNLTARARALTRALACADDGLFDVDADARDADDAVDAFDAHRWRAMARDATNEGESASAFGAREAFEALGAAARFVAACADAAANVSGADSPPPTSSATERENEGGSWCSAEVRTPATARRDRRRGKAFIAYVDSADDDDETK
jgi:hypothetical protein